MKTESQCKKIRKHLEEHGQITAADAWEKYNIMRLAARVSDLRAEGMDIVTNMVYLENGTKYAIYTEGIKGGASNGEK